MLGTIYVYGVYLAEEDGLDSRSWPGGQMFLANKDALS